MRKASQRPPSRASLREMPEVDFSKGTWRRNPYAARIAKEGMDLPGGVHLPSRRGRPKKGEEPGSMTPRSVRLPPQVWKHLQAKAKAKGLTTHGALRVAIVEWIAR